MFWLRFAPFLQCAICYVSNVLFDFQYVQTRSYHSFRAGLPFRWTTLAQPVDVHLYGVLWSLDFFGPAAINVLMKSFTASFAKWRLLAPSPCSRQFIVCSRLHVPILSTVMPSAGITLAAALPPLICQSDFPTNLAPKVSCIMLSADGRGRLLVMPS